MTGKPKNVKAGVGKRPAQKSIRYTYDATMLKDGPRPSPWFRMYRDIIYNPKFIRLTDRQSRAWLVCLCMADQTTGKLPPSIDLACHFRTTVKDADDLLTDLINAGLVDAIYSASGEAHFAMHGWTETQFKTDRSGTERMRRHREAKRHGDVTVTSHGTEVKRHLSESVFTVIGGRTKNSGGDGIDGSSPSQDGIGGSVRATLTTDTDGGDR